MISGISDSSHYCKQIALRKLQGLLKRYVVAYCVELTAPKTTITNAELHTIVNEDSAPLDTTSLPPQIARLIEQHQGLLQEPSALPSPRADDHHIPLIPGAQPVNIRPYRYSPQQKTTIENQVADMLKRGIIQPSSSPFASPVLLVKKKDGTWRFCVDYRHLNAITVKNKYPLPIVHELLDELARAKWFTKLDFRAGYHQIRVAKADEMKTTFKTHSGLYEFKVMPFGLTNAPASFQSIMNKVFEQLLRMCVLVFMDDILIYSSSIEEHDLHLKQVFQILQEHQFFVKFSKCVFAQQELEYLCHLITAAGVATEPSKIAAEPIGPLQQMSNS
jgi:hypothetical protein